MEERLNLLNFYKLLNFKEFSECVFRAICIPLGHLIEVEVPRNYLDLQRQCIYNCSVLSNTEIKYQVISVLEKVRMALIYCGFGYPVELS